MILSKKAKNLKSLLSHVVGLSMPLTADIPQQGPPKETVKNNASIKPLNAYKETTPED